MSRVRLSVDIDAELKHKVAVIAALRGTTISELVVDAVQRTIESDEAFSADSTFASLRGVLSRYADKEQREREADAWGDHVALSEKA